ncbi:2-oxoacid:acceptor oxidoreductase family protein [Chloroflexota bacterium]
MRHFNIIICGVGGTGVIGLGELLREAARLEDCRVLTTESRGVSQRGGPATASVRYTTLDENEKYNDRTALWSGSIGIGGADLMIATEVAEALRNAHYLSENSRVILNTFTLMPKQTRQEMKAKSLKYPSVGEVVTMLHQLTPHVYVVNASDMSMEHFGSYRMTNPILVGLALARGLLPLKKDTVKSLLQGNAKEALELNFQSQNCFD